MTTTALVPVFTGILAGQPAQLCNARDLHATLEVGKDFSMWIKDRIEQYGFSAGEDFAIGSPKRGNQPGRGGDRRSRDYHLTLDMAKELAMIENNPKGRQVRRYFIECERRTIAAVPPAPTLRAIEDSYALAAALLPEIAKTIQSGLAGTKRRWFLSFDYHHKPFIQTIPDDAYMLSHSDMLKVMVSPEGAPLKNEELEAFIIAATRKLASSTTFYPEL